MYIKYVFNNDFLCRQLKEDLIFFVFIPTIFYVKWIIQDNHDFYMLKTNPTRKDVYKSFIWMHQFCFLIECLFYISTINKYFLFFFSINFLINVYIVNTKENGLMIILIPLSLCLFIFNIKIVSFVYFLFFIIFFLQCLYNIDRRAKFFKKKLKME